MTITTTTSTTPPHNSEATSPNAAVSDDAGYKVGYGHPPKATQFKLGQTSPRKGKKLNKQNHEDLFWKVMNEKVTARMAGRSVQMTRFEACLRKRTELAMSGDNRALKEVLKLYAAMSAAKRGEEIRAVERAQRKLFYAMLDEQERQEAEAQQTAQTSAHEPSSSPPLGDAQTDRSWRP